MLEFIIWLIVLYLVFKLSAKFILPYFIKWYVKRIQEKFYSQSTDVKNSTNKEGSIHIQYTNNKQRSKGSGSGGEYVDFEELPKE